MNYISTQAASANAAKTLQLAVETEKLNLESQLATRNSELDIAKKKLESSEKNLAAVIFEKDKQIDEVNSEVNSLRNANAYLKKEADELNKKWKAAEQEKRNAWKEVDELKSPSRLEAMITEYKGTQRFKDEVFEEAYEYFNRGVLHAFRNLHQFVPNKRLLVKVYEGVCIDPELRSGCDFVPFSEKELADIAALDKKEGRSWTQPEPVHPNFDELCELSEDEWEEEASLAGVNAEVAAPEVIEAISVADEVPRVDQTNVLPSIPEVPEADEVEADAAQAIPPTTTAATEEPVPASFLDPPTTVDAELVTPVDVSEKNGEEESTREDTSVGVDPATAEVEL